MRKMYIKVEATLCVVAEEGLSVDDIMDSMDFTPSTENENFDIEDFEVERFYITDSK